MMEFCLEGEVASAFFCAFFLHCLPKEIRVLLIDEVRGNLKDLPISADELYQHQKATPVSMLDCTVNKELAEAVVALAMKLGKGNSPAVRSQAARAAATVVTPMVAMEQWWWSQCHSWRCCRWWSQQSSQRWSQ